MILVAIFAVALVVYGSLSLGPSGGLAAGAIVGMIIELSSPERAGLYPMLYGVVGWVAGRAWERTIRRSPTTEFFFLAGLGFVVDTILLAREGGLAHGAPSAIVHRVIPSALATGVAGPLASAAASRLFLPLHFGASARVRGQRRPA